MAAIDSAALKARLVKLYKGFTPGQLVVGGLLLVVAVLGGMMFLRWVTAPSYAVLYSGLRPEDAAEVTAKLTADGVPYQLSGGGSTISVPAGKLDQERLALSAEGLPKGGSAGWETLDKEGLTASSFRQQVDYQRALEGEVARTLRGIDGVRDAQVHLVLPEERLFTDQQREARASVLLTTAGTFPDDKVASVVSLVASAVPDLAPEKVTVTDGSGRLLSAQAGAAGGAAKQLQQQTAFETEKAVKAQTLLDQLLGPGRAVVRVSAELDFDKTKVDTETFDDSKRVIEGYERNTEKYTAPVPGTVAGPVTVPNETGATQPPSAESSYTKTTDATKFGNTRTVTTTEPAPGTLEKLNVSVAVDTAAKNLPPNVQLSQLVGAAVGLDAGRGDRIVVTSMAFESPAEPVDEPVKGGPLGSSGKTVGTAVAALMLLVITVLLARSVRRPKTRDLTLPDDLPELLPAGAGDPKALPGGAAVRALPAGSGDGVPALDLLHAVENQPDDVTALLRSWLADTGTGPR
jgi:flagellar M-ring protein FliF